MPLSDIFKSKEELDAEQKKLQRKEMREANRSCERVQADLDRQAKELEAQIKQAASKNDTLLAKTLAKQLIKVRNEKVRAVGAKSKINSIQSQAASMQTNNKLAQIMGTSAAAMSKMNQQIKPEQLANTVNQFQQETMKMDMTESAFEDMFDELFEGDEEEADSIMEQVLSEIAIDTSAALSKAPATSTGVSQSTKDATRSTATSSKAKEHH